MDHVQADNTTTVNVRLISEKISTPKKFRDFSASIGKGCSDEDK
jgi:hypothetical protein